MGKSLDDLQTSDAMAHLKSHNIKSSKTKAQEAKKEVNDQQVRVPTQSLGLL